MKEKQFEKLIYSLAVSFAGKKVVPNIIEDALSAICSNFSMTQGVIYDMNQFHHYRRKEAYAVNGILTASCGITLEHLGHELKRQLTEEVMLYCDRANGVTGEEEKLLALFSADRLAITAVVDERKGIRGLVVLTGSPESRRLEKQEENALSVVLSMLGRYIGIRMYQNKLAYAQSSLESILDNTGIDIYVNDFENHDILYANKSMAEPYGGQEEFAGKKCWAVLFPGQEEPCEFCPQKQLIDEEGNPTKVYSWDYQRPFDGSWFRVFSAAFRWVDGRLAHVVSSANITDNKKKEEIIEYMANYDLLTKLPNRRMLIQEGEKKLQNRKNEERCFVMFFDLDGFKRINDQLGHDAGDEFLVSLSEFLNAIPLIHGAIYRQGGDEFVAVVSGAYTQEDIRNLAGCIHERFHKPWELTSGTVYCNASIGVSSSPEDGKHMEELIQKADQAMYLKKHSGGRGICFYEEGSM